MTIIYEYFEKICKDAWPSIKNFKADRASRAERSLHAML